MDPQIQICIRNGFPRRSLLIPQISTMIHITINMLNFAIENLFSIQRKSTEMQP